MNKQRQRSEATRTRIVEAAERAFAQQGFDASSVASICRSAGVTKGAFYHHFTSKQDLFLELLRRWLKRLDDQMTKLREDTASIPKQLISMTDLLQEVIQATENQFPIYFEFWTHAMRDPSIRQELINPFYRYQELFTAMVSKGVSDGSLKDIHPETTARLILAIAMGLLIQAMIDQDAGDWGRVAQECLQILFTGIGEG